MQDKTIEPVDADFGDEMDNKSFKIDLPQIDLKALENLFDFDEVRNLKPDTKADLIKSDKQIEEEIVQAKKRADFLKEIHEKRFSGFEKIKNNYYLEGELAIKVKKSLLRNVKHADGGENPSANTICAMLSEYPKPIKDIPKDNPNFMDNFKNGLIMAVDEDGFDIDTLKIALMCPKRKEMLKIINEVKNRNSLKFGDAPDAPEETQKSEKKHSQKNAVADTAKLPALPLLDEPEALLALASPHDPDPLLTLASPTNQDIDAVFNVDDLDFGFDDDNPDFTHAVENDFDLEIEELDKPRTNVVDRSEELENLRGLLKYNTSTSQKSDVNENAKNKSRSKFRV